MGRPTNVDDRTGPTMLLRLSEEQRQAIDEIARIMAGPLKIPVARVAIVKALLDLGIKVSQQGGEGDGG